MTDNEFFEVQFPGSAQQVHDLRARDREFDQICADYHEVFSELARGSNAATATQPRYLADLAECLSDLRASIERRLSAARPRPTSNRE